MAKSEFRCRAVNEFGAEFSEPAVLEVLGKYFFNVTCTTMFQESIASNLAFRLISFFRVSVVQLEELSTATKLIVHTCTVSRVGK